MAFGKHFSKWIFGCQKQLWKTFFRIQKWLSKKNFRMQNWLPKTYFEKYFSNRISILENVFWNEPKLWKEIKFQKVFSEFLSEKDFW